MPAIVGVTVGPGSNGVAAFATGAFGVTVTTAGVGVTGGRVGTATKGVKLGSRPALGEFRETSQSSTITSAETIDAMTALKNPRLVLAAPRASLSAMRLAQ
jgi:hypothetical protein